MRTLVIFTSLLLRSLVRPLPKSPGTSDCRAGTPTAARGVCPEASETEAISVRPSFLGRALAPLAALEEPPCRCSPGDRSPLAPQRVPPLLEVDLDARTWTTSDLGRNQGPHRRMATENGWRARKIQAELMKLGIRVSLATDVALRPEDPARPNSATRRMTFLRNHKDVIAGMDFFVVPTVRFRLLYVWFVIDHGRRRILHFNVAPCAFSIFVLREIARLFRPSPPRPSADDKPDRLLDSDSF